jgi:hypothetical protein
MLKKPSFHLCLRILAWKLGFGGGGVLLVHVKTYSFSGRRGRVGVRSQKY